MVPRFPGQFPPRPPTAPLGQPMPLGLPTGPVKPYPQPPALQIPPAQQQVAAALAQQRGPRAPIDPRQTMAY